MTEETPETAAAGPAGPPPRQSLELVLDRVAAQVLRLAIPDSPFAAGSSPPAAPGALPLSTPQIFGFEPPSVEVPPVVAAEREPASNAVSGAAGVAAADGAERRIAALRAAAPRPIAPVVIGSGFGQARAAAPSAANGAKSSAAVRPALPAIARPPAAPPPRPHGGLRVRRPPPSLRRLSAEQPSAPPPAAEPHANLFDRLNRAAALRNPDRMPPPTPPASAPAAKAAPSAVAPATAAPSPPAAPVAEPVRTPARERPMLAPTGLAAPVPETRPLTQNRRLYRRVMLAAELTVDGKPCRLVDLSIGGFAAAGAPKLGANTVVPVHLRMNIDGIDIGTQFSARVVYANEARAAGRFVDLTAAQTAFLRYIVTWRGEAIGAAGTTNLLNAITRWPQRALPPHPSTEPPAPEARQSWWERWFGRIPLLGRKRGG